jgi:hypothetical protein
MRGLSDQSVDTTAQRRPKNNLDAMKNSSKKFGWQWRRDLVGYPPENLGLI